MNEANTEASGIYIILNTENGKHYVGSSKCLRKRSKEHAYDLDVGRHSSRKLQHAWNKYGPDAFRFDVVEEVPESELLVREQHWMDVTLPFYNIARQAASRLGIKCSEETKQRIREAKANISQETRDKIAEANRRRGPEARRNMSEAGKNRPPISEETRAKLSEAGRGHSEEARKKQGAAWIGRQHSEESLEKMRQAQSGKVISDEQREKLREANLGKKHSEETKRKMREAHERRRAEKLAQTITETMEHQT